MPQPPSEASKAASRGACTGACPLRIEDAYSLGQAPLVGGDQTLQAGSGEDMRILKTLTAGVKVDVKVSRRRQGFSR